MLCFGGKKMKKEEYQRLFELEEKHWWYLGMKEISLHLLSKTLAHQKNLRILDAGCGTGGMMRALDKFGQVSGIDISHEAINLCRARNLKRVNLASVEKIPFQEESFDLVTSFDVLYHQWVTNDLIALGEYYRVLKTGGYLLVRVPSYNWLRGKHDEIVATRHRYTKGELVQKVKEAGFEIKRATYTNMILLPPAVLKRVLEKFLPRGENSDLVLPSSPVNEVLKKILYLEAFLVSKLDLPFGLSLFVLAKKPSPQNNLG